MPGRARRRGQGVPGRARGGSGRGCRGGGCRGGGYGGARGGGAGEGSGRGGGLPPGPTASEPPSGPAPGSALWEGSRGYRRGPRAPPGPGGRPPPSLRPAPPPPLPPGSEVSRQIVSPARWSPEEAGDMTSRAASQSDSEAGPGGGARGRRAAQSQAAGPRGANQGAAAAAPGRGAWFFPRKAAAGAEVLVCWVRGVRGRGAVMSGFDDPGIFYSDSFGGDPAADEGQARKSQLQRRFKEFLRQYRVGTDRTGFTFKYRDELKRHYNLGEYWVEVEMEDLASFDEDLADYLYKQPAEHLQLLEEAAKEVADEVTRPRPTGEEVLQDIQVMLKSDASPSSIRSLKSDMMSHLVKIPGIIISASGVRAKATRISIQCRSCRNTLSNIAMRPGLEGYALPRKCNTDQAGRPKCPLDPYFIMPDKCKCVDFQTLKLQELPDAVPHGEMPRHMQLYCDRYLCDKVVPGNRVTIMGIYSIKKFGLTTSKGRDRVGVGIRSSYIRVLGIQVDTDGSGRSFAGAVTPQEEEEFRRLAALPNVYEVISKSIAPSIFGGTDMKKAIACLLFGGSRKRLPDGLTRRGDINLLMLGDPGTAKSQLLKFVEKCSPIGVYTSGKGSSAAGLTASVMRDPSSRNFIMEGGAMVLADGGVVCIDEFDKMREDDRVAIHEAMEQQTISIAKAGITTTLNSRCSVLAAANSVFGRWDETKGEDNIDFMPTILSRFDMIFIVKDEHNEERDVMLAKHVITLHVSALTQTQAVEGEVDLTKLKKFIAYCRAKCGPRLSAEAAEKLKNRYIIMRSGARQHERDSDRRSNIPITVRQLEAIVRIAEALSKMKLQPFATEADVEEALRLFQVSTLDAALSGTLSGVEGFTSQEDQELLSRIEKQLKRRFAIGSQVSEHSIIQDFTKQKYPEHAIHKVLQLMLRRGEIQHRMQRKVLYRLK
uniref:DNA replication licensing factor MCM5 n=4 Tax=Canis lupus TaxID=9612 RepID=A0A8C0Q500_CANLF